MKKNILAVALCLLGLPSFAGTVEALPTNPGVASMTETTPRPVLELATLVGIRNELTSLHAAVVEAAHDSAVHSCKYEDKTFSEGAIRQVGRIGLVCVRPEWDIKRVRVVGQGNANAEPSLVWEPLSSPRLEAYRGATHMPANAK